MEYFDKHQDNQPENNGPELSKGVGISDIPGFKSETVLDGVPNSIDMKTQDNLQNALQSGNDNGNESVLQGKERSKAGSKQYLELLEHERAIKVKGSSVFLGLVLAFMTGISYAMFSPLFNLATNDQFHLLKPEMPHLSVYVSFFYFSIAFFILAISVNIWLLYFPILGLPKSSISSYLSDVEGRHYAIMAGILCAVGNGFQFMGGQAAGYAAADAVQALPLVGTFWGIVLFGEYRNSSWRTYALLTGMLTMFAVAVSLLVASARQRVA